MAKSKTQQKTKTLQQRKITKRGALWLIGSSLIISALYIALLFIFNVVELIGTTTFYEMWVATIFLSVPLVLPAIIIAVCTIGSTVSDKTSWLYVSIIAFMPAILVLVIFTLILLLLNDTFLPSDLKRIV